MSTIITLIGALVLGLVVLVVVLWRRTHRDLRYLRQELRATQQELKIQRILIETDDDGDDDGEPKKRRHLRALALLAPVLLWIRDHPALAAAIVGTAAAMSILVSSSPSEPRRLPEATPSGPVAPPSHDLTPPPTLTRTTPPATTSPRQAPGTDDPGGTLVDTSHDESESVPSTGSATSSIPSSPTTTTSTPSSDGPERPVGSGLCVVVDLKPLLGIGICLGRGAADHG